MTDPNESLESVLAVLTTDKEKLEVCNSYTFTSCYDPRLDTLRQILHSPSIQIRESAIGILSKIDSAESVRIISKYSLNENNFDNRLAAVEALTEIGHRIQKTINELVPTLIPWISKEYVKGDTDMSSIAINCLQGFGEYTSKELIALLIAKSLPDENDGLLFGLSSTCKNDHLKLAALTVLKKMKNLDLPLWFDKAFKATEDEDIHEMLIGLAGHFKEKALVPTLIKMLQDPGCDELHPAIAEALGDIGDPKAIKPLIGALKRRYYEGDVKLAAASALESFANIEMVRDALATQLSFNQTDVSEKATEILYEEMDERSVEYVLTGEVINEDWALESVISVLTDRYCIENGCYDNAIKSLGAIGGEKAVNALIEEIIDKGPDIEIISALLNCGSIGITALNNHLDAEEDYRHDVISILINITDPSVIHCLQHALIYCDKKTKSTINKVLVRFDTNKAKI
ncbi:MAG: HEAT repeat domain-containing protein [Legionella sp.]|uniref:HEAT repeat domain-containing protein n=1 Tax=Legionella sp. TaxID=459 RepID=UPI00283B5E5B|nr:HEAT repeat domain-containing protein [Legionella sp.]